MTPAEIIALVTAVLKFPDAVKWFVKELQDTPEERRAELMAKVSKEIEEFKKTGRPTWD